LKGYFISNQQSNYFESDQFKKVLQFVQTHPRLGNLKEVKNTLRIAFENIRSIDQAIKILTEITQQEEFT
jgi:transcription-repair coupling factor (superfamily II helicase)